MMKQMRGLVGLLVALPCAVWANVAFYEGFAVLRPVREALTFYDTDTPTLNPEFNGIISFVGEDEYLLLGGEVKATRGVVDSSETFAGNVVLNYTINGGPTNPVALPRIQTSPDQFQAASTTGMVNLASALSTGSNTIRVWFTGTELNHPVATPSVRMPATGAYEAVVVVVPKAPGLVAKDDAGHPAYARGLTNNANGGFGFGPWTNVTQLISDGAAGTFIASNPPNADLNHIATESLAWALFANEGGTGGNDIQIAAAYRPLGSPLALGQTLSFDLEHGGIQSGSLNANNPPRNGGFVGVGLRFGGPTQSYDPDPISAFGGLNDIVLFGFRGGDSEYVIMDVQQTSGRPTGLPFTTNGVRVNITRIQTNLLSYVATSKGPGSTSVTFTAQIGGEQPLAWLAVYNRNAEQNDVFFNNLLIEDAPVENLLAYDDAADGAYAAGWTNNANGGFGFAPWSLGLNVGTGGAAGHFLATNPPNTDLNVIDTGRRAWGAYANNSGNPTAGVQFANGFRGLAGGVALLKGQTLGFSLEHGGIASVNGQVQIRLLGTPTFVNQEGIEFTWTFNGGSTDYTFADDRFGQQASAVPFSFDGLRFDFTLVEDQPFLYALRVESFGTIAGTRFYYGPLASAPKFVDFRIRDVEENDVFFNRLYVRGLSLDNDLDGMPNDWEQANGTDPNVFDAWDDDDLDGFANLEEFIAGTDPQSAASFFVATDLGTGEGQPVAVSVPSVTGRVYTLEVSTNLLSGTWSPVPGQANVPGTGALLILTNTPADQAGFRLNVKLP
ncbi:MAG TPA: hypothetical protein PKC67_01105 [Kiritimatiellia bacterium]|nr:hypothetical protein [Kiritimatiellia bacterium]HMP32919.1 hypothetical protein [Kiritimatiellia bacterium]